MHQPSRHPPTFDEPNSCHGLMVRAPQTEAAQQQGLCHKPPPPPPPALARQQTKAKQRAAAPGAANTCSPSACYGTQCALAAGSTPSTSAGSSTSTGWRKFAAAGPAPPLRLGGRDTMHATWPAALATCRQRQRTLLPQSDASAGVAHIPAAHAALHIGACCCHQVASPAATG
jgi:hypothetical protein